MFVQVKKLRDIAYEISLGLTEIQNHNLPPLPPPPPRKNSLKKTCNFCFQSCLLMFVCLFSANVAPVEGHWGRWGPWSKCSRTCGQGYSTRSRQCDDPRPLYGGKFCSGTFVELKPCRLKKTCKCLYISQFYLDRIFIQ